MSGRVLVACEESGRVRDRLLARGIDAISCDLEPSERPGPHIVGDVRDQLDGEYAVMIAHPPCTYLSGSGARWLSQTPKKPRPGVLYGDARRKAQAEAVEFVKLLHDCAIPHVAIENPVGMLSSLWREADQYVQPHQFGEPYVKKTGFWLKNLPLLQPTDELPETGPNGEDYRQPYSWKLGPSPERTKLRSKTYWGIADAIAEQWGRP